MPWQWRFLREMDLFHLDIHRRIFFRSKAKAERQTENGDGIERARSREVHRDNGRDTLPAKAAIHHEVASANDR